jgi:organic radical activating enzyme
MNNIPNCSAIDTGLFLTTDGGLKTCCSGAYDLGNLRVESLSDVYNGEKYIKIRNALVNHQQHKYCLRCDQHEETSGNSQRVVFNKEFPSTGVRRIKQIDLRWSNLCNLTCRYCNSTDSSEWAKLRGIPIESVSRDYASEILETVEKNKESIECVYLLGGEPLLQKYNINLLDIIKPSTKIDILTNLSVDLTNNRVYQKLKNFSNVIWNISFDNIQDRFEYVRHGASWELFLKNIDIIIKDFSIYRINFHPVYSIWSAFALKEYQDFAKSLEIRVNWQLANEVPNSSLNHRVGYTVFDHKIAIRHAAIEHINQSDQNDFFTSITTSLKNSSEIPDLDTRFLNWTHELEKKLPPKKTFQQLWPEVWDLLHQKN